MVRHARECSWASELGHEGVMSLVACHCSRPPFPLSRGASHQAHLSGDGRWRTPFRLLSLFSPPLPSCSSSIFQRAQLLAAFTWPTPPTLARPCSPRPPACQRERVPAPGDADISTVSASNYGRPVQLLPDRNPGRGPLTASSGTVWKGDRHRTADPGFLAAGEGSSCCLRNCQLMVPVLETPRNLQLSN
ncbi:hypothetical protein GQ53DRAFT_36798 [Thozetella sp. PMI_491]|nr:hypothetical protein GQ53DRAFT_36798 [Thozetella sp. PMI_491]